jgi:hypothetical protein
MFVVTNGCWHDYEVKGTFDTREAAMAFIGDAQYEIDEVPHNLGPHENQNIWEVENGSDGSVHAYESRSKYHLPVGFQGDVQAKDMRPPGKEPWVMVQARSTVSAKHARELFYSYPRDEKCDK